MPAHFRCRSVIAAYVAGDEVGDRASTTGSVPTSTTFTEFLKKQGKDFQEEVLGVEHAKQFRAGKSLDKFIDKSGHLYTLKELKARET